MILILCSSFIVYTIDIRIKIFGHDKVFLESFNVPYAGVLLSLPCPTVKNNESIMFQITPQPEQQAPSIIPAVAPQPSVPPPSRDPRLNKSRDPRLKNKENDHSRSNSPAPPPAADAAKPEKETSNTENKKQSPSKSSSKSRSSSSKKSSRDKKDDKSKSSKSSSKTPEKDSKRRSLSSGTSSKSNSKSSSHSQPSRSKSPEKQEEQKDKDERRIKERRNYRSHRSESPDGDSNDGVKRKHSMSEGEEESEPPRQRHFAIRSRQVEGPGRSVRAKRVYAETKSIEEHERLAAKTKLAEEKRKSESSEERDMEPLEISTGDKDERPKHPDGSLIPPDEQPPHKRAKCSPGVSDDLLGLFGTQDVDYRQMRPVAKLPPIPKLPASSRPALPTSVSSPIPSSGSQSGVGWARFKADRPEEFPFRQPRQPGSIPESPTVASSPGTPSSSRPFILQVSTDTHVLSCEGLNLMTIAWIVIF